MIDDKLTSDPAIQSVEIAGPGFLKHPARSRGRGGVLLPGGAAVAPADMCHRGPRDRLSAREPAVNGERMMASKVTARARENREYVRSLLKIKQPEFAAALESAVGVLYP